MRMACKIQSRSKAGSQARQALRRGKLSGKAARAPRRTRLKLRGAPTAESCLPHGVPPCMQANLQDMRQLLLVRFKLPTQP